MTDSLFLFYNHFPTMLSTSVTYLTLKERFANFTKSCRETDPVTRRENLLFFFFLTQKNMETKLVYKDNFERNSYSLVELSTPELLEAFQSGKR